MKLFFSLPTCKLYQKCFPPRWGLVSGLQIISRLAPVKLSGQTYFCSDIAHFWLDKHRLRLIAIKVPPQPLHMMFKYETSKFSKHLLYMSIDLNAGKVERMVQQNQYHICAYYYCLSSTSYIWLVMKLMKLTEACNLVDFKCCQKQGSSFPKMRDWTFKIQ